MTNRFICLHGHFYQPPRENPWLEHVEVEDSATPYHDWNERITAECYAPNMVSRVLDGNERIVELVNNYEKISFNFGPTLLSWLEHHRNDVYKQILDADRVSVQARGGHGNAIAQCYNHAIMPLASAFDKLVQVGWGIADFEFRFGRKPKGMWLPETAVDLDTLQVLAEHNIEFTILAPKQAKAVRAPGDEWQDVSGGHIDPTRAYRCLLKDGKHITLFFYDQPVSHDLSFEGLLKSGDRFADRLMSGFNFDRNHAQLMHIATDGETFGHHSRFGDMALAYAINRIERDGLARITNYSEYLELHPAEHEVQIHENTSWSCAHGVDRWKSDCGCNSGGTNYHQKWRAPLRNALDSLRERLDEVFKREASALIADPHAAVLDYIRVILDRSRENCEAFLNEKTRRELTGDQKVRLLRLFEMQRNMRLMYTSCGWFFDDIANIETVKILEYAARAIQLAREVGDVDLEPGFIAALANAPGNKFHLANGARVYEELVRPSITSLEKGLAHYGISSLIEDYAPTQRIFSFEFERIDYAFEKAASRTLAIGSVNVRSRITGENLQGLFILLHFGGYDFHCVVRENLEADRYDALKEELFYRFRQDSTGNLLQAINSQVGGRSFALKDLFVEERRKIGRLLAKDALERSRDHYRRIHEESSDVMRLLASMRIPAPESLKRAAEYVLTQKLEHTCVELRSGSLSENQLNEATAALFREAESLGCKVDVSVLKEALNQIVYAKLESYRVNRDPGNVESALNFLRLASRLGVELGLWRLQNLFWELLNKPSSATNNKAVMSELGEKLRFSERLLRYRL